jgi:hypothetical protein
MTKGNLIYIGNDVKIDLESFGRNFYSNIFNEKELNVYKISKNRIIRLLLDIMKMSQSLPKPIPSKRQDYWHAHLKHESLDIKNYLYGIKQCYYKSPLQGEVCFRSSWELAYAMYLDKKNVFWMYEHKKFKLSNGTSYTPDFYLVKKQKYIEIKGIISETNKEKMDLFRKEYPEIKFKILYGEGLVRKGISLNGYELSIKKLKEYNQNKKKIMIEKKAETLSTLSRIRFEKDPPIDKLGAFSVLMKT